MTNDEEKVIESPSEEPAEKEEITQLPINKLDMSRLIELDACVGCGECLKWCPVYDQDASEDIVPRRKVINFLKIVRDQNGLLGKILRNDNAPTIIKSFLKKISNYKAITKKDVESFVANLYECSTCGQCEVVCPAHIDTVNLWENLREIIVDAGYGPLESQKALEKSVKSYDNPWQQPRAGRTKWSRRAKKDNLIPREPRPIKDGGKVLLFLGCTASYDANVKQVAINTINILEALDVDYGTLGKDEKCCGSVLLRMGDPEHKRLFQQNIEQFNSLGIETLISSCAGCFKTIMQDYPKVGELNFEVLHTVEYLVRLLKQGKLKFPYSVNRTVTYHDPCHLGRASGVFDAPRIIMDAIPGLKLIEMPRNRQYSRCCGAGGGLKAGYPDIQNKMAQRRVREAEETGADELVSCCPFCYQGLQIGINAISSNLVMKDMSAYVAEALLGYDVFEKAAKDAADAKQKKADKLIKEKEKATSEKDGEQQDEKKEKVS
jgi:heterodisulfide reductase subunit D